MNYRVTTIIASIAMLVAPVAHAGDRVSAANNVGTGNVGFANGNFNSNGNAASNARGGNATGGGGGSVSNSNTYKNRVPGAIGAPGLAAGANTCAGSVSAGVSFYGGGLGLGKTYEMHNCEARAVADQAYRYGLKNVAIQVLYDEHPMFRRAMDIQRQSKKRR
jgi:hypothetical protein